MIDLTLRYLRISPQQNTLLILKTLRHSNIRVCNSCSKLMESLIIRIYERNVDKDRTPVVDTKRFRNQTFVLFLFIIHHIYIYIYLPKDLDPLLSIPRRVSASNAISKSKTERCLNRANIKSKRYPPPPRRSIDLLFEPPSS